MRRAEFLLASILLVAAAATAAAASVDKAMMLREHALLPQAKTELIEVIFSQAADPVKARAYYELGSIAFLERNMSAALDTWTQLATKHPTSPEAALVKNRIKELAEVVGELSRANAENAVAQSYLEHGDFWSHTDMADNFPRLFRAAKAIKPDLWMYSEIQWDNLLDPVAHQAQRRLPRGGCSSVPRPRMLALFSIEKCASVEA